MAFNYHDDVTERVRATGIDPQAVWRRFSEGVRTRKIQIANIKNLPGYLVGMARKMAKEAYGQPDPKGLAASREALMARRYAPCPANAPIPEAVYDEINAKEAAERGGSPFNPVASEAN